MKAGNVKRLKELKSENAMLKQVVANEEVDSAASTTIDSERCSTLAASTGLTPAAPMQHQSPLSPLRRLVARRLFGVLV